MRVRSVLLSTVLCSGILALSITASRAAGTAGAIMPQGSWSVSKAASAQPGEDGYCALSRRFGDGSTMIFARNAEDKFSIAVDFPREIFKPKENYTVMLDAGNGEMRSYEIQPASKQGIVVRSGQDAKFFTAMEKSGQLGVNVAGQSKVFALPDMQGGMRDLSSCLARQDAAAAVTLPANVTALQQTQEENIRLRAALEEERRNFENKFVDQDGSAVAELNEKLRLLEKENHELRLQSRAGVESRAVAMPDAQVPNPPQEAIGNDQEIARLKAENAQMQSEMQSRVTSLQNELTKLRDTESKAGSKESNEEVPGGSRVAALQEEIERLRAQNSSAQVASANAGMAALKDRIGKLEAENSVLKAAAISKPTVEDVKPTIVDITGKEGGNDAAAVRRLKAAEAELAAVKAERDRLAGEIGTIRDSDADGRVRISSDNWNLEQATLRFNETEREVRRLGSALEQERAKCAVEKKDLEYMLFDPKIATQQQIAHLNALEADLAQMKEKNGGTVNATATALQQQLAASEMRVKDLEQKLADAKMDADQARRSAATESSAQDGQADLIASLRQEIANLNTRMASMQSDIKPSAWGGDAMPKGDMPTMAAVPAPSVSGSTDDGAYVPRGPESKSVPVESMTAMAAPGLPMMTASDVESLLKRAGLKPTGKVVNLEGVSEPGRVAYRWENGDLFGTAEQKTLQTSAQFDRHVRSYVDSVKSHCQGKFTAMPVLEDIQGDRRISTHQITCIGDDGNGAAAALLFYTLDGRMFTTMAYEAPPKSMDAVAAARDKIVAVLRDTKVAGK